MWSGVLLAWSQALSACFTSACSEKVPLFSSPSASLKNTGFSTFSPPAALSPLHPPSLVTRPQSSPQSLRELTPLRRDLEIRATGLDTAAPGAEPEAVTKHPEQPLGVTEPTRRLSAWVGQRRALRCKAAVFSALNIPLEARCLRAEHAFSFIASTLVLGRVIYKLSISEQNPGCDTKKKKEKKKL